MPIQQDDGFDVGINPVADLTGLVNTGYDIYADQQKFGLQQDNWGMQKKLLNQQFIKQQRDLDWQARFRDLMLGVPGQTPAVK